MHPFDVCFLEISEPQIATTSFLEGKFIQLRHHEIGEFLVFGLLTKFRFHAQIADLFFRSQSPPWNFEINNKGDNGTSVEENVEIVGGGMWRLSAMQKTLELQGSSQAFGDYECYGLSEKITAISRFADYKIAC